MTTLRLFLGLCLVIVGFFGCTPEPVSQDNGDSWNSVRSNWKGSKTHDENSSEAQEAYDFYQNHTTGNSAYVIDHFQIVLKSVATNSDGTQTWTYVITKLQDGRDYNDLSHFDLVLNNCSANNYVNMHGGSYGPDPAASSCVGVDVVKWDRGVSYGESVEFVLTTDKAYAIGQVEGVVKYSTTCNKGALPGPDCSKLADDSTDDGETDDGEAGGSEGGNGTPADGCPSWIDTLELGVSITYKNYHGYNHLGFPVYYVGETMHSDLKIKNDTDHAVTGLTVKTIVESYPSGNLACGQPVQEWTGVTIAPHDTLVLDHSFHLSKSCAWGNYQSHVVITREADNSCPVAALIVDNGKVGFFDP